METAIQGALFDLDGVIVFTDKYHYLAWKRLADEEGWDFNEEINHGCRGVPRMESLQVILNHNGLDFPLETKRRFAERKNAYYRELLAGINESDLYPGVEAFLDALAARGVKLALCSASKNAKTVLEKFDLARRFDVIVTGMDIQNAKPNPEIFLLAAQRLKLPPRRCVVFEDAPAGVQAAQAAGMACIGVGTGDVLPDAPRTILRYDEIDITEFFARRA